MKPLQEAIKKKYGVSDEVSNQVIASLAEIEKHRQDEAGGQVQGFRARTSSEQGQQNRQVSVPDIATIAGNSRSTSGTRSQSSVNVGGTGLIGIVISIVFSLIKMFLGSRASSGQAQNNSSVINILSDLTNGATTPGQAPDLTSILGGLLGGSGGGSGNQGLDLDGIMNDMLNNQASSTTGQPKLTKPKPR